MNQNAKRGEIGKFSNKNARIHVITPHPIFDDGGRNHDGYGGRVGGACS